MRCPIRCSSQPVDAIVKPRKRSNRHNSYSSRTSNCRPNYSSTASLEDARENAKTQADVQQQAADTHTNAKTQLLPWT